MSMVCSRGARNLSLPFCLWAAICAPGLCETQQYEGKRIVEIEFSPVDQPLDPVELREILPLKPNTPLHMADVSATIERLFATGRYEDIQVDAEPSADGVIVRFITRNSWFIGRVFIDGSAPDPPNRGQMVNATRLNLGQPFHEENMSQAEAGLRKLLVNNGYY